MCCSYQLVPSILLFVESPLSDGVPSDRSKDLHSELGTQDYVEQLRNQHFHIISIQFA